MIITLISYEIRSQDSNLRGAFRMSGDSSISLENRFFHANFWD